MKGTKEIYDQLFRFESRKSNAPYPIHKSLRLDKNQTDLADWLIDRGLCLNGMSVLDVGCGTGNTLFKLAKQFDITGLGISISEREIDFAKALAKKQNTLPKTQFRLQSFDEDIEGKYDLVIAIESLKHSRDLSQSLINLTQIIHQNSVFMIADDFLSMDSPQAKHQGELWDSPSLLRLDQFEAALAKANLEIIDNHDFTKRVVLKSERKLARLIPIFKILNKITIGKYRTLTQVYLGALLLEQMYHHGLVGYHILIVKPRAT